METLQKNIIKRNTIAVFGTSTIDTNATQKGDEIRAYKKDGGWTMLNVKTGKYFECSSDFLRRFVIISEQVTI